MKEQAKELLTLIEKYEDKLILVSDESFSFKPNNNVWSNKEILGHLIDSGLNNIRRFVLTQSLVEPLIKYDQDAWVITAKYQSWETSELISTWKNINMHIARIISHIPPQNNDKKYRTASQNLYTLKFGVEDYITHLKHHINQILK